MVIRIKGEALADCAGALLNGLLAPTACRPALVTLDLSELRSISSLAMGVLTGFRNGVVRSGGQVRVAGPMQPAVHEALTRANFLGLFAADVESAPRLTESTTFGFWLGGALGTGGCPLGSWVTYTHPVAVASSAFWWGRSFGRFGGSLVALSGKWIRRILNYLSPVSEGADEATDDPVNRSGSRQDAGRASPEVAAEVAPSRPIAKWPRYVPVPPAAVIIEAKW
jgi:hypothetical protein